MWKRMERSGETLNEKNSIDDCCNTYATLHSEVVEWKWGCDSTNPQNAPANTIHFFGSFRSLAARCVSSGVRSCALRYAEVFTLGI